MINKYLNIVDFIKSLYPNKSFIPLHEPVFNGKEKDYLNNCIDSTFVSYVGEYVVKFEEQIANFLNINHAIAVVNGTVGIHVALLANGIKQNDEVLTQSLTFVATANAISHAGGVPVFIDCEKENLGMDPNKLEDFLYENTIKKSDGFLYNKITHRRINACIPVHIFGHPVLIEDIINICNRWNIPVIEDATESLGSSYKNKYTGGFGNIGVLSFNGNKVITTGGGGMIVTNDSNKAKWIKHITTTAKLKHPWEFRHDEIAFNFRMPNVNAAIGYAQMENINNIIERKRNLCNIYKTYFQKISQPFFTEKNDFRSNYWLNTILLENRIERDQFLELSNKNGVMTRPVWNLLHTLPMYKSCFHTDLTNSIWLEDRLVNIPSSINYTI